MMMMMMMVTMMMMMMMMMLMMLMMVLVQMKKMRMLHAEGHLFSAGCNIGAFCKLAATAPGTPDTRQ